MNGGGALPGWYPDPAGGYLRYYDGSAWTAHTAPLPPPTWGGPPWKGARYGRPQFGTGALGDPWRRLGARLLDGLVFLPVAALLVTVAILLVAPHIGPLFPAQDANSNASGPTPGIFWLYLAIFCAGTLNLVLFVLYEAVATKRYGRTLGKRWLRLRPVTITGAPLGWGQSFGRAGLYSLASCLSWLGLVDYLWCLWDDDAQCLHDKAAKTLVVRDE